MAALPGGTDVAITHKFISGKADGPDPSLVQPSKWNQDENLGAGADGQHILRDSGQVDGGSWVDYAASSLTNRTGGAAAIGDVVAISTANDSSVVLGDTVSSLQRFVVALQAPADAAVGAYGTDGPIPNVKATGAIARGQYVRKSATTKTVEDAGVTVGAANTPPAGALGIALNAAAAGIVTVLWFAQTAVAAGTASGVSVYDRVVASVTVGNTAAETTIYTKSIAGNDLSTNKRLVLKIMGTIANNEASFGGTAALRLKYGATTLATVSINCGDAAVNFFTSAMAFALEATLQEFNATNVQHGLLEWRVKLKAIGTSQLADFQAMVNNEFGTAAIDSTSAQNLVVTMQWGSADASNSFIMKNAVLLLE